MDAPTVVVVGLGPAGPDLTTAGARAALSALDHVRLRTGRHPAAAEWSDHPSFDDVYDREPTFDAVYAAIVEDLVTTAANVGRVGYAVPGSPFVLERTVSLLLADPRISVEVVAGMSFLDLAWGRLGVDPVEAGVRLVDGHRFAADAAGATGALLVAHCHANHVLSDIKLAFDEHEPPHAVVLRRLGLPDEEVIEVPWADLDRSVEADHLTSLFVPAVRRPVAAELVDLVELVRVLRAQCPWDRAQTHATLTRYLVEEAYEAVDAIGALVGGAGSDELCEELGDVLFQVVFHATIAAESGEFDLADVARGIGEKLRRRHPHVFDPESAGDDLVEDWERIKAAEKGRSSILDGIPTDLPALLRAQKVLSKADRVGVELPDPGQLAGAPGAEATDHPDDSLGAALLGLAVQARSQGLDAESSLRRATARLAARVAELEREGRDPA